MNPLDAELLPMPEVLGDLVHLDEVFDAAGALAVTAVVCDLPVELAFRPVHSPDGELDRVVLSPPRQPVVTSVMPVLHRLRIRVVARADG